VAEKDVLSSPPSTEAAAALAAAEADFTRALELDQVREHSSADKHCTEDRHVAISPALLVL